MNFFGTKLTLHPRLRRTAGVCRAVCYDCRAFERIVPAAFFAAALLALSAYLLVLPPNAMATPSVIRVENDQPLGKIARDLQAQNVVRNAFLFDVIVRALGGGSRIQAGAYFFPVRENTLTVALRLESGDFELKPVRVTIAEGATAQDIGDLLSAKLQPFDESGFLALAKPREGYLYPDTYFFYPGQDPASVEGALENNYNKHMALIAPQISAANKPVPDILTAASILVGEARTDEDRRIVAGIIWKRLRLGMPLQVDAPFGYVLDKSLTKLTPADLQIDSPYNTYKNKGLPPTPINNPSIEAILAAAEPLKTPYLYYLSDRNGVMHYSATYAQHLLKIQQYL